VEEIGRSGCVRGDGDQGNRYELANKGLQRTVVMSSRGHGKLGTRICGEHLPPGALGERGFR